MAFELPYMPECLRKEFRFNDDGYHQIVKELKHIGPSPKKFRDSSSR
jgi:hypothetical protein